MFSKLAFVTAVAALFTSTLAHMIMVSPHPFAQDTLNNSPLDGTGSDYPCKQRDGVYGAPKGPNEMPAGAPQTLSFQGSAVHGGGSCQISLTTDKAPGKDSQFKVIHSIIGGCPSNATDGNLPENSYGSSANKYTFSIPDDVPNGDYTLAWTWFNKIGNREMYMNCAPVTVTGGKGSPDTFNKLPNMFIANVGPPTATVQDSTNVIFPNPGNSVETDQAGPSNVPAKCPPESNGCTVPPSNAKAAVGAGGGSAAPAPAPAGGSSGGTAPAPAAPAAPAASSPGAQGPGTQGGAPAAGGGVATPAAASPAATGPATPGIAPPAGSVPCNNPGQVVCIGASQFGICDVNNAAVPQPLAQGTHCTDGKISRRSLLGSSLQARGARRHGVAHNHWA